MLTTPDRRDLEMLAVHHPVVDAMMLVLDRLRVECDTARHGGATVVRIERVRALIDGTRT